MTRTKILFILVPLVVASSIYSLFLYYSMVREENRIRLKTSSSADRIVAFEKLEKEKWGKTEKIIEELAFSIRAYVQRTNKLPVPGKNSSGVSYFNYMIEDGFLEKTPIDGWGNEIVIKKTRMHPILFTPGGKAKYRNRYFSIGLTEKRWDELYARFDFDYEEKLYSN